MGKATWHHSCCFGRVTLKLNQSSNLQIFLFLYELFLKRFLKTLFFLILKIIFYWLKIYMLSQIGRTMWAKRYPNHIVKLTTNSKRKKEVTGYSDILIRISKWSYAMKFSWHSWLVEKVKQLAASHNLSSPTTKLHLPRRTNQPKTAT